MWCQTLWYLSCSVACSNSSPGGNGNIFPTNRQLECFSNVFNESELNTTCADTNLTIVLVSFIPACVSIVRVWWFIYSSFAIQFQIDDDRACNGEPCFELITDIFFSCGYRFPCGECNACICADVRQGHYWFVWGVKKEHNISIPGIVYTSLHWSI